MFRGLIVDAIMQGCGPSISNVLFGGGAMNSIMHLDCNDSSRSASNTLSLTHCVHGGDIKLLRCPKPVLLFTYAL